MGMFSDSENTDERLNRRLEQFEIDSTERSDERKQQRDGQESDRKGTTLRLDVDGETHQYMNSGNHSSHRQEGRERASIDLRKKDQRTLDLSSASSSSLSKHSTSLNPREQFVSSSARHHQSRKSSSLSSSHQSQNDDKKSTRSMERTSIPKSSLSRHTDHSSKHQTHFNLNTPLQSPAVVSSSLPNLPPKHHPSSSVQLPSNTLRSTFHPSMAPYTTKHVPINTSTHTTIPPHHTNYQISSSTNYHPYSQHPQHPHPQHLPHRFVSGAPPRLFSTSPLAGLSGQQLQQQPTFAGQSALPRGLFQSESGDQKSRNTSNEPHFGRQTDDDDDDNQFITMNNHPMLMMSSMMNAAYGAAGTATNGMEQPQAQVVHVPVFRVKKRILMKRQRQGCCGYFNICQCCNTPDGLCSPLNCCGCLDREVTTKFYPDGRIKSKVHPIYFPCFS